MALFAEVAQVAEGLASERSRLKKRASIAAAIAQLVSDRSESALLDAGRFCMYLAGQPFSEADPRKLNSGGAILSRAVREVAGASEAMLTGAYRRHGDLGAAAFDLLAPQHGKAPGAATLTLDDLSQAFDAMASARSTELRFEAIAGLLRRTTALEAKYLLKLMLGDMRIGVKQSLVEEAIAEAAGAEVAAVRHAVMLEADLAHAVCRAFTGTLSEARMTLFHPLGFMLASPVETPEEAVERFTVKPAKTEKPKATKKPGDKKRDDAEADFADVPPFESLQGTDAAEAGYAEDVAIFSTSEFVPVVPPGLAEGEQDGLAHVAELQTPVAGVHALLEDKYDGMRAQVHCGDPDQPGRVAIYSRNREDITESFPEIEEAFGAVAEPLILDGEILGWDLAADKALPFAVLGQRIGRKRVNGSIRLSIPVIFMAFDLLFEGAELLLPVSLQERRTRLEAMMVRLQSVTVAPLEPPNVPKRGQEHQASLFTPQAETDGEPLVQRLRLSPARLVESAEAIDQAYRDARARANEGVMLKSASSAYLPGRRGLAWLKLKRELATLDVVITGAEFGNGKRSQVLSDYTFAVRGPEGELLNVGKAYSGLTDAEIAELTEWLKAHTLEDFGHFRTVEPLRMLEVAFNNVMRSDRHASGFALRFPRIIRVRDDKPLGEIDTLERVEEIYQSQPDRPEEVK